MNILELFEKLNLEKGIDPHFSPEEVIKIEKRINVEKKLNPEIDANVASNLVLALKNYPEEFNFLVADFQLYNFFANTRYPREEFNGKKANPERIRYFISQFLEEDLGLYFDKKMAQDAFEDMDYLLQKKEYFPEGLLYKIEKRIDGKIDFALNTLHSASDQSRDKNAFLKQRSFYKFLSHFSSPEMDESISLLINCFVEIYNVTKKPGFGESAMLAIVHYDAFDPELNDLLANNVATVHSNTDVNSSGGWNLSGRTILIIVVIVLKLMWAMNKCSSNESNTIYQNSYNNRLYQSTDPDNPYQSNYPSQSSYVDSVFAMEEQKIISFKSFLVEKTEASSISQNYKASDFKTGDNPFVNIFKNPKTSDLKSTDILFSNTSNYDVVVLEIAVKNTSIGRSGIYASRAYYIKSKESFSIKIDTDEEKLFSLYFGNDLASFGENQPYQIFDAMSEFRFAKIPKQSWEIIGQNYQFVNDVNLSTKGNKISIKSQGMWKKNQEASERKDEFLF